VEHFNGRLNKVNPFNAFFIDSLPNLPPFLELDAIPSLAEVREGCQGLKNDKACGPGGLSRSYLNMAVNASHAVFTALSARFGSPRPCLSSGKTPTTSLSAKGRETKESVAITVVGYLPTCFSRENPCSQPSLHVDGLRSTIDMVFVARLLQDKCREQNQHLFMAFFDLTKALHSVNKDLWINLSKCGCPPKFTAILADFHADMSARVFAGALASQR